MIRQLSTRDVGPARKLDFEFAPRLNILTGDNGLGKTFILDVLWWVLTSTWAGEKAFPWRSPQQGSESVPVLEPLIGCQFGSRDGEGDRGATLETQGIWSHEGQEWKWKRTPTLHRLPGSGPMMHPGQFVSMDFRFSGVVLYARLDGVYAIWEPYLPPSFSSASMSSATILTSEDLWNGRKVTDPESAGGKRTEIRGLIEDWVTWQQSARSSEFVALERVLHALSSPDERLVPGQPTRVHLRDRRDIPTLATSTSLVPVTLASAGMRRVLSLAYLLVWAWTEHTRIAQAAQRPTTKDMVVLLDEPELHLHPSWQRTILPALLEAVAAIAPDVQVQIFATTHSPLVLASVESVFSEKHDNLIVLERDGKAIRVNAHEFGKEGDVSNWLSSEVFGAVGGRSREAQLATDAARHFMAERDDEAEFKLTELYECLRALPEALSEKATSSSLPGIVSEPGYHKLPLLERVHQALKFVLPGHDEFWAHWSLVYRSDQKARRGKVR